MLEADRGAGMMVRIGLLVGLINLAGTSTIGYSGVIMDKLTTFSSSTATNRTTAASTSYHNIKGWVVPDGSAFYNYSISVDDQGVFEVPIAGIYLVTANIRLKASDSTSVEISVRHRILKDICYCRGMATLTSGSETTVSICCFVKYVVQTNIAVNLQNEKTVQIVEGSTISMHYFGLMGNIASFVLPVNNVDPESGNDLIPVSIDVRDTRFFNDLTEISNLARVKIPCSGIYLITLSMIVKMTRDSIFSVFINNVLLLKIDQKEQQQLQGDLRMISFMQSVKLLKNDVVRLVVSKVNFLEDSMYGVVRVGDVSAEGVSSRLTPTSANNNIQSSGQYMSVPLNFNPKKLRPPHYENSRFITNSVDREIVEIHMGKQGIYLFSIHLETKEVANNGDIDLVVLTKGYYGDAISAKDGLRTFSKPTGSGYLILSGLLRLHDYDQVTILLRKNVQYKDISLVSIVKVRPFISASAAMIPMTAQKIMKCVNKWKPLVGFEVEKDEEGKDKEYFDLNENIKMDKFVVPSSGIYLIMAEAVVQNSGEPVLQNVVLALGRGNSMGEFEPIVNSYVLVKQKQQRLTIRHITKLRKDESLMFQVTCNKTIEFVHRTKLQVIFLSNTEDISYLESSHYNSYTSLERKIKHKSVVTGTYFATLTMLVNYELLKGETQKVQIYVYPENKMSKDPKVLGVMSTSYLNPNEMGLQGLVTFQVTGFLQLKKGDTIITGMDIGSAVEKGDATIVVLSELFSCVSLSNPSLSQYNFKSVQQSKSQFMINNDYTLDMFDSVSLIYQSSNARFFGPQFIVDKPMMILYDFSMALQGVKGEFIIQVKIRPRPGQTYLSEKITVIEVENLMLKAVGVLRLEQSESVEIIISSKRRELLMSSYRSWSVIELVPQSSQRHRHDIIALNSDPIQTLNTGGYLQSLYSYSKNVRAPPNAQQLAAKDFPLTNIYSSYPTDQQLILDTACLTVRNTPLLFTQPYAEEINFSVQSNSFNDVTCTVTFLELAPSLPLSVVTILLKESKKIIFYAPSVNKSVILTMCFMEGDDLVVKSKSKTAANASKQELSLKLTPIDTLDNAHGFFGSIKPVTLAVEQGESKRVVEWIMDDAPYFSSKVTGLYPLNGAFILKESGYYHIMLSILLQKGAECELLLMGDTIVLFSRIMTTPYIRMSDVLHLQSNLFIQLLVKCEKQQQEISFKDHSVFSIYLIESNPSFLRSCVSSNVALRTNIRNDSFNVPYGTDFELKCYDQSSAMGDFLWKRDNEIVYQINGGREATLKLENLTTSENGMYHCEMKRGLQQAAVTPIQITVVDPRPQLGLSSNSVYVGENYSANKLLAWVKVKAKNVETNQDAEVRFTIIEGNEEGNFYTEPSTSTSHTSVFFHSPFDFEKTNEYNLKIMAENLEYDGKENSATATLAVRIENRNEHRPKFPSDTKTKFTLKENTPKGVVIYRFNASDADTATDIRYSCNDLFNRNLFSIDEKSGDLTVIENVDFEDNCEEINLAVCALDGVYRTCIYPQIKIINENDNLPYFIQSVYSANISGATTKPGASILTLRAADKDTQGKENKGLKFSIVKGNDDGYFIVDGSDIKLVRRYTAYSNMFQLYVNVSDGYNDARESALVKLHVLGEDPVPLFSKTVYYTSVVENSPIGSTILQLPLYYDGKLISFNENLIFSFTIKNLKDLGKKSIDIDDRANVIVASEIDREEVQTIFLLATACIRTAGLDKCGFTHVTINVTDLNDNCPVFEKESYEAFITDTKMNETFLLEVRATDRDSEGPNSQIFYKINDPYDLFRINNVTGEIFTTRAMNDEDGKYFELTLVAKDSGTPPQSSEEILVSINVLDTSAAYAGLLKNWEFWILPCLVSILLLLMLAVATMTWKYRRSRRRFQEYLLEQPAMLDNDKRNSFLNYMAMPTSSKEETMYMSCGTIPSAYNSQGDGLNNKRNSVMFTENGYTSFAGDPHHSKNRSGAEL